MAEITLGDLLHWQRQLTFKAPAGESADAALERAVTWTVTIRAAMPVVPPIRGGEIVILPPRILEQIERTESLDRRELLRMLADQPVAALLVDQLFAEQPGVKLPLLVTSGAFPPDAEPMLNRLLTERRTELYQLGSELSRALSTSGLSGAGLDALLEAAGRVARRQLLMVDGENTLLAASDRQAGPPQLDPADLQRAARLATVRRTLVVGPHGEWLAQPLLRSELQGRRDLVLLIERAPHASSEAERLVLSHTADAVELLFGQARLANRAASERANREVLVADLLLGRLASREAAEARARLLSIEPSRPVRVVLFASTGADLAARLRGVFPLDRRLVAAAPSKLEYAVIVPDTGQFDADWRDIGQLARSLRAVDDALIVVASDPVSGPAHANRALSQVRAVAGLCRAGAVDGWLLNAGDSGRVGVYSLLYALWSGYDADRDGGPPLLDRFAATFLSDLDTHDTKRGAELVATLQSYLAHGGALADTAVELGIHRNTLAYRLNRIQQLTGHDLSSARARLLFQVALAIRDLQHALR